MNKIKLSILLLILSTGIFISCSNNNSEDSIEAIYITIPDQIFEEKLIALGIDSDGIVNEKVLKTDVENIDRLDVSNSGINVITNLEGIEAFVNLKRLYASGNELTTIDLSNNSLLDTIHLGFNNLTSIKGLDEAKELKWLSLSGNLFTEFTIENESIQNILMSHNELVSFNASKCANLKSVLLNLNKIESLDFTTNPLLETLIFSANRVESINLTNNVNLKYIYCSSNLFTSFDVSMLNNLIDLRIDRNPTLSCIKIATDQNIPTLKISSYQQTNVNCN